MINGYDIAYSIGLAIGAPFWLIKRSARQKVFSALAQRMGQVAWRDAQGPALMIHAVSLGEINATRGLVDRLRQLRPELNLIVSVTTDTGFARAQELYGQTPEGSKPITLIRYPLDFTSAVNRVLDGLRPDVVVLMELEIWPNFLHQCGKRGIPVVVVNGRMTEPSFRRYRMIAPVVRKMFARLSAVCVQDQVNVDRFAALGAAPDRIQITGTMKFDTATVAERVDGDSELAAAVGLRPGEEKIWVCGSTGPGEEEIVLGQYRVLLTRFPGLRLVIVPRHPQRFDEVANLITSSGFGLIRRSSPQSKIENQKSKIILGDTMGELRKFYSLADIVFVGRTLVDLGPRQHGSDMIEPAALAKPVIVGPYTGNFADVMARFRAGKAMIEVTTGEQLGQAVGELLSSDSRRCELSQAAQQVVKNEKGATERHVQVILKQLENRKRRQAEFGHDHTGR